MSDTGSTRAPCSRCGTILHTGEGRVTVTFSLDDLEALAWAAADYNVRQRLLCAIGLLDVERERRIRREMA